MTVRPTDHVALFAGQTPCDASGTPLQKIIHSSGHQVLADGLEIDHMFSSKPEGGYIDYHQKMSIYIALVSRPAKELDPQAAATTFPVSRGRGRGPALLLQRHSLNPCADQPLLAAP